jgi:hypothetical protein
VIERTPAVIRRGAVGVAGFPRAVASLTVDVARDGAALCRLTRRRRVALVHSNTSVVLGGAPAAAVAGVPHVWHVRELYSRYARLWPVYRRAMGTAAALPCVSWAVAGQRADPRARVVYDGLAIAELLDDEDERERPGAAAAADVRARFDPARLIAEMESLYDAVRGSGRWGPDRRTRPRRWLRSR